MSAMTPREIVHELNKHIVGQQEAKRAVAIALRNRWRRMQLDSSLRDEITPKNILMIGPTGVGKTEIARRLAKLADAPFLKRSEEHTSELESRPHLVCRLLLEKKNKRRTPTTRTRT